MAYGFEIYDAAGNKQMGSDLPSGLKLGRVEITAGNQSGSHVDADIARGTPFHWLAPAQGNPYDPPDVSFSGTTMSWTASPLGGTFLGYLHYGIF